jgi:hypothetical protein
MKTTKTFTSLLFIILIINACSKGCPEGDKPFDKGVDKTYLPYIIPYSDTSTRLFLKNGKDTLLFKSQGLKETFTIEGAAEVCDKYKLQEYSLKMAASDTDFFGINYYSRWQGDPMVNFDIVNGKDLITTDNYQYFYDYFKTYIYVGPINKIIVLNIVYDSVNILKPYTNLTIFTKPNIGILKIETSNNKYELIR